MSKELVPSFEGDLPSGWVIATLGDLISPDGVFIDGDWVESKDQDPNGDVRLIQLADIADGFYKDKSSRFLTKERALELNCTFLKKGDVLIARMPDPLGRACIFPGDAKESVTVVDVCVVRSGTKDIGNKWIMYWVNSPRFRNAIASLQSGTTRRRISRGNLATITFPVPLPEHQKCIVAKIEELFSHIDAGIEALKKAKQLLKQYRQSVLKVAVTGELTKEWREANKDKLEPASQLLERILETRRQLWEEQQLKQFKAKGKIPKDDKWKNKYKEPVQIENGAELNFLPSGWEWVCLDSLIVEGPQNGLYLPKTKYGSGVPIIRIDDFQDGYVRSYEELQRVEASEAEISTYSLRSKNLVINRVNSPTHLGKCMVIKGKFEPCLFESNMMKADISSKIEVRYIDYYIQSKFGRSKLIKNAKWAVNQASINQQDVKNTEITLPPIEEQHEIVRLVEEKIEGFERLNSEIEVQLIKTVKNKQSILSSAFSGKLMEAQSKINYKFSEAIGL